MYEDVTPITPNTTMRLKRNEDGSPRSYHITPCVGYVVHDKELDIPIIDDNDNIIGIEQLGFFRGTRSESASYDFEVNPREFYTILIADVPENGYIC